MTLSKDFDEALAFASCIHCRQHRKGSDIPYIAHLLAVTAIVLEHGAAEHEAIAAVLHDAAEDQGGEVQLRTIQDRFGKDVAQIVEACSDSFEQPKPPWHERKQAFIDRLATAPYSARLVVAADKLHNTGNIKADYRVIGEALWPRFTGGRDGTLWYYRSVVDVLSGSLLEHEHRLAILVAELAQAVAELEQMAAPAKAD